MRKASNLGLTFTTDLDREPANITAPISDSFAEFMKGWYRPLKLWIPYHRGIGMAPEEEGAGVKTINETIDLSIFGRWRADPSYRPRSLSAWAEAKKVDPAEITTSVRVDEPTVIVAD
jgi:hypothetical protein